MLARGHGVKVSRTDPNNHSKVVLVGMEDRHSLFLISRKGFLDLSTIIPHFLDSSASSFPFLPHRSTEFLPYWKKASKILMLPTEEFQDMMLTCFTINAFQLISIFKQIFEHISSFLHPLKPLFTIRNSLFSLRKSHATNFCTTSLGADVPPLAFCMINRRIRPRRVDSRGTSSRFLPLTSSAPLWHSLKKLEFAFCPRRKLPFLSKCSSEINLRIVPDIHSLVFRHRRRRRHERVCASISCAEKQTKQLRLVCVFLAGTFRTCSFADVEPMAGSIWNTEVTKERRTLDSTRKKLVLLRYELLLICFVGDVLKGCP
uniref:Cyclic nucleotide-binding domain-containing protein n=1 Tax=Steinernema glaseri TaxID=37863 RepID=A0A1I8AFN9_9BILA